MKTYQQKKAFARDKIIWQNIWLSNMVISYGELASWQEKIAKLGKRYGLLKELHANGII